MRKLLFHIILLLPILSFSQSAEDDEVTFHAAVDWLDRKLNYIYYDNVAQKWWLNKFYVNEEKEVTIKNIFTTKPRSANIKEKVYLIRKFKIQDINPYQMTVSKVEKDQGRIVKGKMLELRTFSNSKSVHKTVNGRRGSDVSFVQISFPTFMTDSIADYAELVQGKLKEVIIASTKVYASSDADENKRQVLNILQGNFKSDDGQQLRASKKFENVVIIQLQEGSEHYFGFNPSSNLFYFSQISNDGIVTKEYRMPPGNKLLLQNPDQKSDIIEFETINTVRINGTTYYRE